MPPFDAIVTRGRSGFGLPCHLDACCFASVPRQAFAASSIRPRPPPLPCHSWHSQARGRGWPGNEILAPCLCLRCGAGISRIPHSAIERSVSRSFAGPGDSGAGPPADVPPSAPEAASVRTERAVRTRTSDAVSAVSLSSRDISRASLAPTFATPLFPVAGVSPGRGLAGSFVRSFGRLPAAATRSPAVQ